MPEFVKARPVLAVFLAYIAIISLISAIVCIYDKKISRKNRVELRIPEKTLIRLCLFGGSVSMLWTMLAVRHKTKHIKFMLGIPLIIILQVALLWFLWKSGIF